MPTVFKPIRPKKLSEEIVDQIKELISSGDLGPGQRIPSERELATFLGVSRPSVREAIMVLEATGFLEARQGGGTYVRSLAEASIADPLATLVEQRDLKTLHDLTQVRMGLETWSAYLAAKSADESERKRLREIYDTMAEQAKDGGWDGEVDFQFHYTITMATHNTIQIHVFNTIQNLFQSTIMAALGKFYDKEGYIDLLLAQHREILEAIEGRDPERAREKMLAHLSLVEQKLDLFFETEQQLPEL